MIQIRKFLKKGARDKPLSDKYQVYTVKTKEEQNIVDNIVKLDQIALDIENKKEENPILINKKNNFVWNTTTLDYNHMEQSYFEDQYVPYGPNNFPNYQNRGRSRSRGRRGNTGGNMGGFRGGYKGRGGARNKFYQPQQRQYYPQYNRSASLNNANNIRNVVNTKSQSCDRNSIMQAAKKEAMKAFNNPGSLKEIRAHNGVVNFSRIKSWGQLNNKQKKKVRSFVSKNIVKKDSDSISAKPNININIPPKRDKVRSFINVPIKTYKEEAAIDREANDQPTTKVSVSYSMMKVSVSPSNEDEYIKCGGFSGDVSKETVNSLKHNINNTDRTLLCKVLNLNGHYVEKITSQQVVCRVQSFRNSSENNVEKKIVYNNMVNYPLFDIALDEKDQGLMNEIAQQDKKDYKPDTKVELISIGDKTKKVISLGFYVYFTNFIANLFSVVDGCQINIKNNFLSSFVDVFCSNNTVLKFFRDGKIFNTENCINNCQYTMEPPYYLEMDNQMYFVPKSEFQIFYDLYVNKVLALIFGLFITSLIWAYSGKIISFIINRVFPRKYNLNLSVLVALLLVPSCYGYCYLKNGYTNIPVTDVTCIWGSLRPAPHVYCDGIYNGSFVSFRNGSNFYTPQYIKCEDPTTPYLPEYYTGLAVVHGLNGIIDIDVINNGFELTPMQSKEVISGMRVYDYQGKTLGLLNHKINNTYYFVTISLYSRHQMGVFFELTNTTSSVQLYIKGNYPYNVLYFDTSKFDLSEYFYLNRSYLCMKDGFKDGICTIYFDSILDPSGTFNKTKYGNKSLSSLIVLDQKLTLDNFTIDTSMEFLSSKMPLSMGIEQIMLTYPLKNTHFLDSKKVLSVCISQKYSDIYVYINNVRTNCSSTNFIDATNNTEDVTRYSLSSNGMLSTVNKYLIVYNDSIPNCCITRFYSINYTSFACQTYPNNICGGFFYVNDTVDFFKNSTFSSMSVCQFQGIVYENDTYFAKVSGMRGMSINYFLNGVNSNQTNNNDYIRLDITYTTSVVDLTICGISERFFTPQCYEKMGLLRSAECVMKYIPYVDDYIYVYVILAIFFFLLLIMLPYIEYVFFKIFPNLQGKIKLPWLKNLYMFIVKFKLFNFLKFIVDKMATYSLLPFWYKSTDKKNDKLTEIIPIIREKTKDTNTMFPIRRRKGLLIIMLFCLLLVIDGTTACSEFSQLSGIISNNQGSFVAQSSFLLQDGFTKCFNVKNPGLADYSVSLRMVKTNYLVKTEFLYYTSNIHINQELRGYCDTKDHLDELKNEIFGSSNPDIPNTYVTRKFDQPLLRMVTGCGWFTDASALALAYPSVDYTKPHMAVYKNIITSVTHLVALKDNLNGVEKFFNITGYSQSFNVTNFVFSLQQPSTDSIGDVFYTINKLNNAFSDIVDEFGIGDVPVSPATYGLIGGEQHYYFNDKGAYISKMVIPNFPMYAQFLPINPSLSADVLSFEDNLNWNGITVKSNFRSTTFDTSKLFPDGARYKKMTSRGCQLNLINNKIQKNNNNFIHAPEYSLMGCPPTSTTLYFQSTYPISIVSSSAQIKSFKIISANGRYQDLNGVDVTFKIDSIGPTITISCQNVQGNHIVTPQNFTFNLKMFANLDTTTINCCIMELNLCDEKVDLKLLPPLVPLYSQSLNFPNITTSSQQAASSSNWWIWLILAVVIILIVLIAILVIKTIIQKKFFM